jgi:FkbM family methyltransferase
LRIFIWPKTLGIVPNVLGLTIFGCKVNLHPHDNYAAYKLLVSPGSFDPLERALLKKDGEGKSYTFIDIGANIGAYSLYVARNVGITSRVIAFEPQPVIYDRLCENLQLNPDLMDRVELHKLAITNSDEMLTLNIPSSNRGEASVIREGSGGERIQVAAVRLWPFLKARGVTKIDALKIDVEGAEDIALLPFYYDAPRDFWPRLLVMEKHGNGWKVNCLEEVINLGYRVIGQTKTNAVLILNSD